MMQCCNVTVILLEILTNGRYYPFDATKYETEETDKLFR